LTSNKSGSGRGSLTVAIVRRNVAEVIFVSRSILGRRGSTGADARVQVFTGYLYWCR
jgi:hypothetical protein